MSEEDALSTVLRSSSPPLPPTFSAPRASLRKRSRHSYTSTSGNSSDVPVFSSDDLADACASNYSSPRRKKLHRGTWWKSDGPGPVRREEQRRRAMDSGVFMSSDSSSNDDGFSVDALSSTRKLKDDAPARILFASTQSTPKPTSLHGEDLVRHAIFECEESGNETIDLSNQGLTSISGETLRPLRNMIRHPKLDRHPQTDDEYQSLAPSIKLFLSSNSLRRVPGEIINLENLTVLSLRNNNLTELPHSIGKLHNLVELNISGNKLRWLPWELLKLLGDKLLVFHVEPNPLLKPDDTHPHPWDLITEGPMARSSKVSIAPRTLQQMDDDLQHVRAEISRLSGSGNAGVLRHLSWMVKIKEAIREHAESISAAEPPPRRRHVDGRFRLSYHADRGRGPTYLDSSAVTFYEFDGSVSRGSRDPPSRLDQRCCPLGSTAPIINSQASRVPSLFELALRSYGRQFQIPDTQALQDDCAPASLVRGFELLGAALDEGESEDVTSWRCPTCSRGFVIPRAEWVEYWHVPHLRPVPLITDDVGHPFLRRACAWTCAVPGPVASGR